MNPMDPKFLRTHIRRPRNIKRRFSAALALWCAYRKRPAGGCAGAGTHLYRAAGRERASIGLAPSPCRRSTRGAAPRVPWPVLAGFTRIYTYMYAESGWNAAESKETGRSGSRARRDRPSKKPTPLPQRRRPHANQIKGRSRLVVRPQGRESQRVRRTETELLRDADLAAGLGNALGDMPRFFCLQCPLSFVLYAPSKQSREARPCVFSMQCLLLQKRTCSCFSTKYSFQKET